MASQNAIQTVEYAVLSNLPLCDEMICVDNGSTDGTVEVLRRLEKEYDKITFHNRPDIVHLYENRQIAFKDSSFRWIVRGDADFIAWNSGHRDIRCLRRMVLESEPTRLPTGFEFIAKYVISDWTKTTQQTASVGRRIYQHVDGMEFCRLGRWEGVRNPGLDPHTGWTRFKLDIPYWMHASLQAPMVRFLRLYRTLWRELGDFETYPTVESYTRAKYPAMFDGDNIEQWARAKDSRLVPYTGEYPEILGEEIERSRDQKER